MMKPPKITKKTVNKIQQSKSVSSKKIREPNVMKRKHLTDQAEKYLQKKKWKEEIKDNGNFDQEIEIQDQNIELTKKRKSNTAKNRKNNLRSVPKFKKLKLNKNKISKSEKPNWSDFKKQKKELRKKRKEHRFTNYELSQKAKKIWEKVRRKDCPVEQRKVLVPDIYDLVKKDLKKMVLSHDMSRIIQWLLKYSPADMKEKITEELICFVPAMLQSKYARFCVKVMLKHGSKDCRKSLIQAFHGNVVKIVNHSLAAPIFETMYVTWANLAEKHLLQQEFYGDLYKHDKENDIHCLEDVFKKSPLMKEATLGAVKANLTRNIEKKLMNSSILHTVLHDYLKHCSENDREEMFFQLNEMVADLSKTKHGTQVALQCIWSSKTKAKKQIMKHIKGNVMEISKSEHGYIILLALFDIVDDTIYLRKMLMPEILGNLLDFARNEYGRKVILYLVAHRDPMYFHPSEVETLKTGAAKSSRKKDEGIRISELLDAISDQLLETIKNDIGSWISNSSLQMVVLAVLKSGKGNYLLEALTALAEYICDTTNIIKENDGEWPAVEHCGLHMILKKLIQHDKERVSMSEATFSSVLTSKLTEPILRNMMSTNRGCFLLVALLESTISPVIEELTKHLKHLVLQEDMTHSTGAALLLKKYKAE